MPLTCSLAWRRAPSLSVAVLLLHVTVRKGERIDETAPTAENISGASGVKRINVISYIKGIA